MRGPLWYIGGKSRIAARLVELFPAHKTYVEAFAGGAHVLFAKPPSHAEVLNDLNDELMNLFRMCQHHHPELFRCLEFSPASRQLYRMFLKQDTNALTEIQRAARFLYLQRHSFGGMVVNPGFRPGLNRPSSLPLDSLQATLEAVARRLASVHLESRPYERILERYDRPQTFFYLDPPYVGLKLYRFNFHDEDFGRLAERLTGLKGKFLLSINDTPVARKAFRSFQMSRISLAYSGSRAGRYARELLFSNYEVSARVGERDGVKLRRKRGQLRATVVCHRSSTPTRDTGIAAATTA